MMKCFQLARPTLVAVAGLALWQLVLIGSAAADPVPARPDNGPRGAIPAPVVEELRQIQRALGGSAVEAFPSLRDANPPLTAIGPAAPGRQQRQAIEALRESAAELDATANRLERLDLFQQADALRDQAQRLRLDARGMLAYTKPSFPAPPLWGEPARRDDNSPTTPGTWDREPSVPRVAEPWQPTPEQPDNRQNPPTPRRLEPTPSPE